MWIIISLLERKSAFWCLLYDLPILVVYDVPASYSYGEHDISEFYISLVYLGCFS